MYPLLLLKGLRAACFMVVALVLSISTSTLFAATPQKILILDSQAGAPYDAAREAMLKELKQQGYTMGDDLEVSRYDIHNKVGLGRRILLVEAPENYDAIFVNGTIANQAAYQFGYGKPEYKFVFCSITDPVGEGLVDALNTPPKSNFTGVTFGLPVEERLAFLSEVLPGDITVGMIYAEMPQSLSYISKLKMALKRPEFSHINIIFRPIAFVNSDLGHLRMAKLLESDVRELNEQVDLFMTPSDQLGIKEEYAKVVTSLSDKPLMGLSKKEIKEWGAHFGLYPVQAESGKIAGKMIGRLLKGEPISNIVPTYPQGEYGINKVRFEKAGLRYSESVLMKAGANVFE